MGYSKQELKTIYDKNSGYCKICDKKLAFTNHGRGCEKGSWEVDHGNPKSRGGVSDMRNLNPVCYPCNREKGDRTTNGMKEWIKRKYSNLSSYQQAMIRKYCNI